MARSIWSGSISFGLVTIPIKIYTATTAREISFRTLCKNNHRLENKRWCPIEKREVSWDEVKKGYEISKDQIIPLDKKDLEKIKIPSTRSIDIKKFVDMNELDPLFIEKSYYIVPQENISEKSFSLFSEVLSLTGKIAIGKLTLREKEYVIAIRPYKNALLLHTLHHTGEIRSLDELSELKKLKPINKEELKLAELLVDRLTSDELDTNDFKDEYRKAVKKLIEAKLAGKEFFIREENPETEAKSLMEALKMSVGPIKKKKRR